MDEPKRTAEENGDDLNMAEALNITEDTLDEAGAGDIQETENADVTVKGNKHGSIPAAVVGGVIGLFVALIIISICCGVTGGMRYFPYILIPLGICFGVVLLNGDKGSWGFGITAVLTALGVFLAPAFGAAVLYALKQGISVLSVPLLAVTMVGKENFLTGIAFSSAYVFPIVFAAIGLAAVWQIYLYYRTK